MFAFLKPSLRVDHFRAVLATRSGRWYSACLRITRDAELAEDAVQDALLKAWTRRDEFRGEAELDTWIHRIALNAAIDLMRRHMPTAPEEFDPDLHTAPAAASPENRYANRALGRDMADAIESLTTMERQCFLLKHVEGWRLEEIAIRLETNVNNIKQALFRAVRKLREDLNDWRGDE
ncbi:MAG: RNA polymerase sigma factor [Usitatibacteraceae bacterium]